MAQRRGGGPDSEEPVHKAEEVDADPDHGHEAHHRGLLGAEEEEQMGRTSERPENIRVNVTARRFRIDPQKKRREYVERLEELLKELDAIISSPSTPRKLKLRAVDTLVRVIRGCYEIVRDVEVEDLESELEKIKAEAEENQEEGDLGYTVQGPAR